MSRATGLLALVALGLVVCIAARSTRSALSLRPVMTEMSQLTK